MSEGDREHWHIDKRIPIALIGTLALQTAVAIWWAAAASTRLDNLERQVAPVAPQAERIVRLEVKMDALAATMSEVKDLLRRPTGSVR